MKNKIFKFFNKEKKLKLPIWLKMFAGNCEPTKDISKESLERIAKALLDKKDVVFLVNSEPYKLSLKGGKIKGEFIKNYKWVLE